MDYTLAKQIYGQPWCMDMFSMQQYMSLLESIKNGTHSPNSEQLNSVDDPMNGIAVININGVIMLESSMSTKGMKEIGSEMLELNNDKNVKGFLIVGNSGGGSSMAVEYMLDVMSKIDKPIKGFIPYGGMACSAMAMILCGCDEIYAEHGFSLVGSFGSVLQISGIPNNTTDSLGVKHMTIYASKSVKKNEWTEEAINSDNVEIILSEFIDPINERILSLVENARPQLKNIEYDNGQTMFAKDAVGSIIDGIASLNEVLSKFKINMNLETLKSEHPEVYNAIVSEEKERVLSWMAHLETDSKTVIEGIKSGAAITASVREELLVKATQKNGLANLASDSPAPVEATETADEPVVEKQEDGENLESYYKDVAENFMR